VSNARDFVVSIASEVRLLHKKVVVVDINGVELTTMTAKRSSSCDVEKLSSSLGS